MAAPITHIILANKVFDKYFSDKNKNELIIGTSFSDIRYLGVIKREKTHLETQNINEITNLSSFESGVRLHSLVDKVREQYMDSNNVYSLIPESPFITQSLKYFEDKLLSEKDSSWKNTISYFDIVLQEEIDYGIDEKDIQNWHKFMQKYLLGPADLVITGFVKLSNKPIDMAKEIILLMKGMEGNTKLKEIIYNFYDSFEILIDNTSKI